MSHDTPASFCVQGFGAPAQHALLDEKEHRIRAVSLEITTQMLQKSLEAEIAAELGRPYADRREGVSTWQCPRCGTCERRAFRRNGHYRRGLTVREGTVTLRMPLVRCRCQGYVPIPWQTVDPRARYWLDVELDGLRHYLGGLSYRLTSDAASTAAQANISHLEAWRTLQEVGTQAGTGHPALGPCPRSVILDEAYLAVDGEKKVFLLAVADDGRVLAVWGPAGRTLEDWQALVEWLTEGGISPLQGLVGVTYDGDSAIAGAVQLVWPRVVLQQCVWHILERVATDVTAVAGMTPADVETIVGQAAHIFLRNPERPDAEARARRRLTEFVIKHAGTTWAATVSRAFEEGTEYLRTPGLQRTNGAAERTIKDLRRRLRPMDGFKSDAGSTHFAVIWRVWKNLRLELYREQATHVQHRHRNLKIRQAHPKLA